MNEKDKIEGREIINSIRDGLVPQRFLSKIAILDEKFLSEINDHLSFVKQNHSSIKFLCGDYGSGKTFYCYAISELGLKNGFVASVIDISKGNFNSQVSMYHLLIQNLHTFEKNSTSAISDILEKWLFGIQKKIEKIDGLRFTGAEKEKSAEKLGQIIESELSDYYQKDITLTNVIKAYFYGKISRNENLSSSALKWLKADPNLTNEEKKELGLKKNITDEDVPDMIGFIACIIKNAGYSGWILIHDELSELQRMPNRNQREEAYEILRKCIDDVAAQKYPYCFFVFAGIKKLFEDPHHGIKSSQALNERISSLDILPDFPSSKEIIMNLKGFDKKSIIEISKKIMELHSKVYEWNPSEKISNAFIDKLSEYMTTSFGVKFEPAPRKVLRELVCFLDKLLDNPSLDPNIYLKEKEPEIIQNFEES